MVSTGFSQRDFGQTNEQKRHLNEKLISELKILFTPQQKWIFIDDFRLGAFLFAFCEHAVQSFTVARWRDLLAYIVNFRIRQRTFLRGVSGLKDY